MTPRILVRGAALGLLCALIATPAHGATFRRYLWMQPPANVASAAVHTDTAKLTNPWHSTVLEGSGKALDWHDGVNTAGDPVFFRARGAAPDEVGDFIGAQGDPGYVETTCNGNTLHWTMVRILDASTGLNKGTMSYQHTIMATPTNFPIHFKGGGSFCCAAWNDVVIGAMAQETHSASCWTGVHVHENNMNTSLWDLWNSAFGGGAGSFHEVDAQANWTRRLYYVLSFSST